MLPAIPPEAGFSIVVSDDGTIATLTLTRPEQRNPQRPETWITMTKVANALPGTVRVLIVRGEGQSFSAGLDRAAMFEPGTDEFPGLVKIAQGTAEYSSSVIDSFQAAFRFGSRPDLLSIALVQGYAIGGGFQLALGCDFRIAAPDVQFSMAEVKLGIVPDLGGTKRLVELVGYSNALDICVSGRMVDADEAHRIGLVNRVVPRDELDSAGSEMAQGLLTLNRDAQVAIKSLMLEASGRSQADQERAEREIQYGRLRAIAGLESEA